MSIKDIKEWDDLTPEERKAFVEKLVEKYPSLFCWFIKNIKKCVYEKGHK